MIYALEYVKSFRNEDRDIILFADAYDSLVQVNFDEIERRFALTCPQTTSFASGQVPEAIPTDNPATAKTCRIIFSAEKGCWPYGIAPWLHRCEMFPEPQLGPYKYINSGGYIGFAKDLINVYEEILRRADDEKEDFRDDQHAFTNQYLFNRTRHRIELDQEFFIFSSFFEGGDHFHAWNKNHAVHNIFTHSQPAILHFNSPWKTELEPRDQEGWYQMFYKNEEHRNRIRQSTFEIWSHGKIEEKTYGEMCDSILSFDN